MKTGFFQGAGRYLLALVLGWALLFAVAAPAQLGGLSPEQIEALRERAEGGDVDLADDETSSETEIQRYEGPVVGNLPSRLEIFYSNRAGEPLLQFGYETFGSGRDITLRKVGGVQENYVIGIGDTISVDLRGQENRSYRLKVDNVGRIILPKLDPVMAAGRRFGDFRLQLERQIESAYIATNVFASIDEVRQVSVLMSGEVNNPGPLTLSGLSTSVDALLLAGGIKKTGSLRDITVSRGDQVIPIDLYSILLGSQKNTDFSLMEGDRIHVAPLGQVVAIGGWVKRPGIYELSRQKPSLKAGEMIELAGGFEVKGRYGLSLLQVEVGGAVKVLDVALSKTQMHEGDLLLVEPNDERARGAIYLEGHVRQSGIFALGAASTLKTLLAEGDILGSSVYMPFALVVRIDPGTQLKTYIPFSPVDVIYGDSDLALSEDDVVHIFSLDEVRAISESLKEEEEEAEAEAEAEVGDLADKDEGEQEIDIEVPAMDLGARRLEGLIAGRAEKVREGEMSRLANAQSQGMLLENQVPSPSPRELLKSGLSQMGHGRRIDFTDTVLLSLFKESRISLYGAVKAPGDYFVMPGISLGQALDVAGGPAVQADLSAVEITTTLFQPSLGTSRTDRRTVALGPDVLRGVKLGPLDVVRVRRVFSNRLAGSVTIDGEVKYPGRFDLLRGERLSSLFQRAGGLTSTAYPYGAVFTRVSAAKAEKDARDRLVDRMESQLATIVATEDMGTDGAAFLAGLLVKLKEAPVMGRVTIEADPAVLLASGKNDILLEAGDSLTVPPRPNSITVVGEVLSPSSYRFDASFDGKDYVKLAGGYGRFADKRRAFVIMPDGQARRLSQGRLRFGDKMLAPGTIVVVPRNLRPMQWDDFFLSVTQISSQLALTAASVAVIGN